MTDNRLAPWGNRIDTVYKHWVNAMGIDFIQNYEKVPLFTTNQGPALWDAYIDHFPVEEQRYHRCSHCRNFIERYGSLVTIGDRGTLIPVMWDILRAPSRYRTSVVAMVDMLRGNGTWGNHPYVQVTGLFKSNKKEWGTPACDTWRHYHVVPPKRHVHDGYGGGTPKQVADLCKENYILLQLSLNRYYREPDYSLITLALSLLNIKTGRGEMLRHQLEWLSELTGRIGSVPTYQQNNLVWLAAATMPMSYCHFGSGPLGSYLDKLLADRATRKKYEEEPMDPVKIRQTLLLANTDPRTIEDIDNMIQCIESKATEALCPVLDTHGNPLVLDGIYNYSRKTFRGEVDLRIKVRKWSFGAGNMMDRYYRIFYTDNNLEDSFAVVDARYPKGACGGAVYQSEFTPITTNNNHEQQEHSNDIA